MWWNLSVRDLVQIEEHVVLFIRLRAGRTLFPYTTLFRSRIRVPRARARTTPCRSGGLPSRSRRRALAIRTARAFATSAVGRSEEHTSELQSRRELVCRLLLEKKNKNNNEHHLN